MFFWSVSRTPIDLLDLAFTLIAYSLCVAAALSAVLWTRAQGLAAAFLGGCILSGRTAGRAVAAATA